MQASTINSTGKEFLPAPIVFQSNLGYSGIMNVGDSLELFNVRVPTSDPLSLFRSEFVSTYEIGDHIYFFIIYTRACL